MDFDRLAVSCDNQMRAHQVSKVTFIRRDEAVARTGVELQIREAPYAS